ncbi:MAG: hypothetical protein ACLP5H_30665 [Desulfomonilaceae bacterium]
MANLAFELQKDKRLRDDGLFQPFKLVSLWQLMKTFDAGKLSFFVLRLSHLIPHQDRGEDQGVPLENYERAKEWIDFVCLELERLRLDYTLDPARELHRVIYEETKEQDIGQQGRWMVFPLQAVYHYHIHVRDLASSLQRELSSKTVMMLPNGKAGYFDGSEVSLSEKAQERFPLAQKEMDEAGKCFAFRRYSACVFHLMRVMEQMTQELARTFRIAKHSTMTWGQVIGALKRKFDKLKDKTPAQKKRKDGRFHCLDLLYAACKGIRNPHTHAGIRIAEIDIVYDEEDTENLIRRIKEFLNEFATLR